MTEPLRGGAGELTALVNKWRNRAVRIYGMTVDPGQESERISTGNAISRCAEELERALAAKAAQGVPEREQLQVIPSDVDTLISRILYGESVHDVRRKVAGYLERALAAPPAPSVVTQIEAIDDREKTKRALDALDTLCDIWAKEVDLKHIVKVISGHPDKVRAMLRQSWIEGAYRGRTSVSDYPSREAAAPKPAPADHSRCSLCGAPRIALNRAGTLFGACTLTECKDPLHDFRVENPQTCVQPPCSMPLTCQDSGYCLADAMGVKPAPAYIPSVEKLMEMREKFNVELESKGSGKLPAPGAERLREPNHKLISEWHGVCQRHRVMEYLAQGIRCTCGALYNGDVENHRIEEALAAAPPGTCPCGAITSTDVESLAATFHDIYQQEAKRQGDVRHKDAYADLPDNVKDFDRVLARYVLANFGDRHASAERVRELIAKWRDGYGARLRRRYLVVKAGVRARGEGDVMRRKCDCPIYCRFCGAKLKRDIEGHYCPTKNCQWQHGAKNCCGREAGKGGGEG